MPLRQLFTIALPAVLAAIITACSGGSETESPDATSAADVVVKSLENFRRVNSFEADVNTRTQAQGLDVTTTGNATLEDGALLYAQLEFDSGEDQEFRELLFAAPDLYMKQADGQWFVLSPWNQGQRPDELSEFSPEDLVVDYEEVAGNITGVEERAEETIDGKAFLHYAGDVDFERVYPEASDLADGEVHADLFLNKADYLPRRVRVVTTFELGDAKLVEDATFNFHDYDAPIVHRPRPTDARPWRDIGVLDAPCTGEALPGCLEAQTELEAVGSPSCEGAELRICLAPLGRIAPELVQHIAEVARTEYGIETVVLKPQQLTMSMVDGLRGQVEGGTALDYLGQLYPHEYDHPDVVLMGVTSVDMYLSTSHFRYTFGVYDSSGHHAVLSSFRMDPKSFGEPADAELLEERFRKYFLRNVGMLYWGYEENDEPTSLLYRDLLSLDDLDRMEEPLPRPQ